MPSDAFFKMRMAHDIVLAYYAHPTAWSEIGWGGPASPRGYVRMDFDERDSWEAAEVKDGRCRSRATEESPCRIIRLETPRAAKGRAPDVFRPGGWIPMREYDEDDAVDFVIVGTGAGGGTLACKLAEYGFSVVALDAGPYFRPLEDFASDESEQTKLYWTDDRIVDGDNPLQMGSNNSGKAVGGSTVHFAMVSLRFRPEWFKSRSRAWIWRRLAARLARDVDLLRGSRAGPEDCRPDQLSVGTAAAALSLSGPRNQCRRARSRQRLRGDGHQMDRDAAGYAIGAARSGASLRLSRLLRDRMLDQRQAERARHLDSARHCRRR